VVFVSYEKSDVGLAGEIRAHLEAGGFACWMAPDDVRGPVPWPEQVEQAIESCDVMLVVVSANASASQHMSREVDLAVEKAKPLLPVRVEDVVPTGTLNYLLRLAQWIDLFPGSISDHATALQGMVGSMLTDRSLAAEPPPPAPPPPRRRRRFPRKTVIGAAAFALVAVGLGLGVMLGAGNNSSEDLTEAFGAEPLTSDQPTSSTSNETSEPAPEAPDSAEGAVVPSGSDASSAVLPPTSGQPDQVLISQTDGVVWSYDLLTGELGLFTTVEGGNYDIEFTGEESLLIGRINESVSQLDLETFEENPVWAGDPLKSPMGVAVSPSNVYYFADPGIDDESGDYGAARLFGFDPQSGELDLLLTLAPAEIKVAVAESGRVYFTNRSLLGRFDPTEEPIRAEVIATIDEAFLLGLAVTPTEDVYVAAAWIGDADDLGGVYKVETSSGQVIPVHVGEPLRNPSDVEVAPNADVYVIDSAWMQPEENRLSGLYRLPASGSDIETLHSGHPLGDVIDIVLAPTRGE
jgi:hypothetical protein